MIDRMTTWLRARLQRRRVGRELDDELAFHVEMEARTHQDEGLPRAEARRQALRDLGGLEQTKEQVREVRAGWLDILLQDLRYTVRALAHRPGSGLAAVAMLALAVGLTTAMFTVVDALVLRPRPFRDAARLAQVSMGTERGGRYGVSLPVLQAWRDSPAFGGAEAAVPETALLEADGTVVTRGLARVTPGLFAMLGGVQPIRGRLFDPSEGRAGSDPRLLLSEDVWRTLYNADPAIAGRRIVVNGESATVVGVLPSRFRFPRWDTVIWQASDFTRPSATAAVSEPTTYVRFAEALPREDALRLATEAAHAADAGTAGLFARTLPMPGDQRAPYLTRAVPVLGGGVLFVFLVLCSNVGSLLLSSLTARAREFGLRSALGASRRRLLHQAGVESVVVGGAGVGAGLGVAWALLSLARALLPEALLAQTLNPLDLDGRSLLACSVAGIASTLAAGLLPAMLGTRVNATESLRAAERGGGEHRAGRAMTRLLLVAEVALACTLLVGATLLVRSFLNLTRTDRGLDTAGVVTATVSLTAPEFPDAAARRAAGRVIQEQVTSLPGIDRAVWSYGLPPDGGGISFGEWTSDAPDARPIDLVIERYWVGPEFLDFYGIPLLRGRLPRPDDPPHTVAVGERLAQLLWPGLDPVGRTFTSPPEQFQVVGLVREINLPSVDARLDRPEFYEPFGGVGSYAMLSFRCAGACPSPAVIRQRLVSSLAGIRIVDVKPLEQAYVAQLAPPRAAAALALSFAVIALVAAAGGLFSVLSYAVGRRRREFGIRTALGASPRQIRRLVLQDGAVVACAGLALGVVASWAVARALASLEYGVTVSDPLSWAVVLGLITATVGLAAWRPARQAARVDPLMLIRDE